MFIDVASKNIQNTKKVTLNGAICYMDDILMINMCIPAALNIVVKKEIDQLESHFVRLYPKTGQFKVTMMNKSTASRLLRKNDESSLGKSNEMAEQNTPKAGKAHIDVANGGSDQVLQLDNAKVNIHLSFHADAKMYYRKGIFTLSVFFPLDLCEAVAKDISNLSSNSLLFDPTRGIFTAFLSNGDPEATPLMKTMMKVIKEDLNRQADSDRMVI